MRKRILRFNQKDSGIRNRIVITAVVMIFLLVPFAVSQPQKYFYHSDREVKLEGVIQKTEEERRYRGRARFLIIKVKDKASQEIYHVELCPDWFLDFDLQPGRPVQITGSLIRRGKDPHILARKITYNDRTKELRDKYGFPNWRGGRWKRGKG